MVKKMNYAEARREARKLFGEHAEVHRVKGHIAAHQYEVGTIIAQKFVRLGVGSTWEKAFGSVKEVEREDRAVPGEAPVSTG